MEKLGDENPPVSPKEVKDDSTADVPAEEVEVVGEEEEEVIDTDTESGSSSSTDSDSDSEYECKVCQKTFSGYLTFKQHQKGKKHAKAVLKKKKEKKLLKMEETADSDEENLVGEPYAECKTCKKDFYGPEAYEQHLKCKKHKQRALEASILDQVKVEGKIDQEKLLKLSKKKRVADTVSEVEKETKTLTLVDKEEDDELEYECKACEKSFSGLIPYTQHLTSKTHAKQLGKNALLHKVVPETHKEDAEKSKQDVSTLCIEDGILVCKACSTSFSGPESGMTHMKSKKHAKQLEKYIRKLERKKQKKDAKQDSKQDELEDNKKEKEETQKEDKDVKGNPDLYFDVSGGTEHGASDLKRTEDITSSNQVNESMFAYEKYKQYKEMMNSLEETDI